MPPKKIYSQLQRYADKVRNASKYAFDCPTCKINILPKDYEKHCWDAHNFDPKTGCAWCREFSWRKGTKCDQTDHLLPCFKKFISETLFPRNSEPIEYSTENLRLMDQNHPHLENYNFEIEHDLPPRAHELPRPLKSIPIPDLYRDANLNLAAGYVLYYCETNAMEWLHVMIKSNAYESFLRAMEEEGGKNCRCLEFSCWCNGGWEPMEKHRQHKHLIVVSPMKGKKKSYFQKNVWPKVKPDDRPRSNYTGKRFRKIVSPLHLVNVIGYVSNRRSQCKFQFDKSQKTRSGYRNNHFFLYKTLPREFHLPLVLLWNEGVMQYLYRTKLRYISLASILQNPLEDINGRWRQKLKYLLDDLELCMVLPVQPHLFPSDRSNLSLPTLHLPGGRKLRFAQDTDLLCALRHECTGEESPDWLKVQAEGGNCFYESLREDYWTPPQQSDIRDLKPIVDRNRELERMEMAAKECSQCEALKKETEALNSRGRVQQEKIVELYDEIKRLNGVVIEEFKKRIEELEKRNKELEKRNEELKKRTEELETENRDLKIQIGTVVRKRKLASSEV